MRSRNDHPLVAVFVRCVADQSFIINPTKQQQQRFLFSRRLRRLPGTPPIHREAEARQNAPQATVAMPRAVRRLLAACHHAGSLSSCWRAPARHITHNTQRISLQRLSKLPSPHPNITDTPATSRPCNDVKALHGKT